MNILKGIRNSMKIYLVRHGETIWNKEGAFSYNRNFSVDKLTGSCAGCDMGRYCAGGCRQMCYFTTGEYYNNPYCAYHMDK